MEQDRLAKQPNAGIEFGQPIEMRLARLLAALSVMEEEFRQEMEAGQKVRWCRWLESYQIETVERATERWIKTQKFLPKFEEFEAEVKAIMAEEVAARRTYASPSCPHCGGCGMMWNLQKTAMLTCECLQPNRAPVEDFKQRQAGE